MCNFDNTNQTVASMGNVAGTYQQMQSAKNQASYQANIANQNAAIADVQALSVGQAGTNQQIQIRQRGRQVAGSQKAALSANGLDISSGSPLSILSDTAYLSEQDAQISRSNTQMQMWGLTNQANNYRSQAQNATASGKNQSNSALLTGISTAAKQYSTFGGTNTPTTTTNTNKANATITVPLAPTDASGNFYAGGTPNYTLSAPAISGVKKYKSFF